MTNKVQAFNPVLNYVISGTNSSVPQAIAQPTGPYNAGGYSVIQIYNPNSYSGFVSWAATSNGTATAGTSGGGSAPFQTGFTKYDMGNPVTSVAVILGTASSGNVYVSIGDGGL
jgi:hypothetical protein